ncbi:HEPN domain-containing protein [Synechococcus sp. GreenBA-s]|jgi:HEPN domain-containing protein|nr:HEPN domain-containing protein [Synechococcus sp. GreenBA-s]
MAERSADWLNQALRDLDQAEASMQADRHEWACFAAHQATEKALKALNLAMGQQAWGHTLTRLWAAVPPERDAFNPPPPEALDDRLRLLDGFYIPTRYPDSYPEGTPGEHFGRLQSEQALFHATAIVQWARAALAQLRRGP